MSRELLLFELGKVRQWTLSIFEGVETEDFHAVAAEFPNSLHWQLGHAATMMEQVTQELTDKNDETYQRYVKYFGYGTSPDDYDDETPAIDEIEALLKGQPSRLEDVEEEAIQQELPEEFMGMTTQEEMFGFTIMHEAMHVGKMQEMKRVMNNR
ncbi:DinB family protein [Salinicoccus sp. ID82-1]|uniref:DinB family protein n=1 Tax=Salinicoccus cyprini TaxID=2493691 RepID=A0A558AU69_9STAP|nr:MULTISPECIES: DinB family protein [Salinicoccus]MCG1010679.1 DinB family protein [Salinicoccus sp. ID82-1]TVT27820.1 DinB family protein [Salinicoccus cyprini]